MAAIQEISARLGRTTGYGIATNIRANYPNWTLLIVALLRIANTINIGADLGAMGDAVSLLIGGPKFAYILSFGMVFAALQVFTLCRGTQMAHPRAIHLFWGGDGGKGGAEAAKGFFIPTFQAGLTFWATIVAILGTTISPYLFFWQASQAARKRPSSLQTRCPPCLLRHAGVVGHSLQAASLVC
jgi:Mn2+/Fe2+ NRAMP family transporter